MAASPQIFLFTGENRFRLRQEKALWINEFCKKHQPENCLNISASNVTYASLSDEISSAPFLADKRIVFVDGIPRGEGDDVKRLPDIIHPASVLVFVEPAPDKRLGTTKAMLTVATVKEFPHLSGKMLEKWMQDTALSNGKKIDQKAIDALLRIVGDDEDQLFTEIQKIALGAKGDSITEDDVDLLSVPAGEQEVWILTNTLIKGDVPLSLTTVKKLLERGEDAMSIWSILLWFLRQVAATAAANGSGERSAPALQQKLGVAFPTARTLLPVIGKVDQAKLKALLKETIDADIALKTGGYRATADGQQEILALLDRLVLGMTGLFASK